tara:strand:- start:259 stop:630 length:372 start_codon:yes stop_codon:yes gene_type:complete
VKETDLNKIAKIEKAIKEKYGEEAIQNPKRSWSKEKEDKYLEDLKAFYERHSKSKKTEEAEGFKIKTRKTSNKLQRTCPICKKYSFESRDDVYMIKFDCCLDCYIEYVEGREERWKSGWRPNN